MEKTIAKNTEFFAEIYIYSGHGKFLTPQRIRLLEAIGEYGSIIRAAKTLPMSYKNAWDCIQDMNRYAGQKLVVPDKKNNGSCLTDIGRFTINMYYGIQKACNYGVMHMNDVIG